MKILTQLLKESHKLRSQEMLYLLLNKAFINRYVAYLFPRKMTNQRPLVAGAYVAVVTISSVVVVAGQHLTRSGVSEDPLTILIRLYAHDATAISDLERVRVNPDFTSQFRGDLEFFIPQLCSFYLSGDSDQPEQLVNLIVMASSSSFFFSHRIWFYFQSMIFGQQTNGVEISSPGADGEFTIKEQYKRTRVALNGIKDACLQKECRERLYLSNSNEIVQLIKELKLADKYPQLIGAVEESKGLGLLSRDIPSNNQSHSAQIPQTQVQRISRAEQVKNIIEEYNSGNFRALSVESRESASKPVLNASDIILQPFQTQEEKDKEKKQTLSTNPEDELSRKIKHYALTSYLSTPKFIMALTEISLALIHQTDRQAYLKEELAKLNRQLPASVYIPFVNDSIRNYAVLHIVAEEAKVFQTKERAPLLLCIEAFRPEELMMIRDQKKNQQNAKNHYLKTPEDPLSGNGLYENYRSNSMHSSSLAFSQGEMNRPLLENPYLNNDQQQSKKQSKKSMKEVGKGSKSPKNKKQIDKEEANQFIRMSDMKLSNLLTIDEVRRTESNLMEKIKVSEGTYHANMRQASNQFNALDFKGIIHYEQQILGSHGAGGLHSHEPEMHAIMEVEDIAGEDDPQYFQQQAKPQVTAFEAQQPIALQAASEGQMLHQIEKDVQQRPPPQQQHHTIQIVGATDSASLQNTFRSQDQQDYLEGNDQARYSNMLKDKSNYKSYITGGYSRLTNERKESGDTQGLLQNGEPSSSQRTNDCKIESIEEVHKEEDEEEVHIAAKPTAIIEEILEEEKKQNSSNHNSELQGSRRSYSVRLPDRGLMNKTTTPSGTEPAAGILSVHIPNEDFQFPTDFNMQHRPSNAAFYDERPQNTIFAEISKEQDERVRKNSPFGSLKTWRLIKIIVKSNDDVRQEQFAMQLISQIDQIFKLKKLSLWLRPYEILATGQRCGLIECVSDALSIHSIKDRMGQQARLINYFTQQFGADTKSKIYKKAQDNFCRSLAAYSLVCYILQVKDRHNGNILIDIEGHIMHIDFGFLLSNAPGKGIKFEQAPFKLTGEMVEILGGQQSKWFKQYRELMRLGFMAIQEHADKIIKLVEMMFMGLSDLPCFILGEDLIGALKNRILPPIEHHSNSKSGHRLMNELEATRFVDTLIQNSYDNWRTRAYDKFQYCCQGIL